jgi:hypothetical protein
MQEKLWINLLGNQIVRSKDALKYGKYKLRIQCSNKKNFRCLMKFILKRNSSNYKESYKVLQIIHKEKYKDILHVGKKTLHKTTIIRWNKRS